MSIGHNGGPPLDDDGPAKLRWVKVNVAELLEGIEELTLEQRGYYLTALFKMYARMGGIPADEREGAKVMCLDVRAFRRLRDHITGLGKFYVEDGLLKNSRVEHEIIDYVREHKRRQEAALLREQRKREMQKFSETSGELPADFSETSGRSSKEVLDTSFGLGEEKSIKSKDAPPQPYHKQTTNQNQQPEPLKRSEEREEREEVVSTADAVPVSLEVVGAFEAYNDLAQRVGLPVARTLTPQRRKAIAARMREHGGQGAWARMLANIERSAFLQGRNSRNWTPPGLDWFLTPANFTKVCEGAYGNGVHANPVQPSESYIDRMRRLMHGEGDMPRGPKTIEGEVL